MRLLLNRPVSRPGRIFFHTGHLMTFPLPALRRGTAAFGRNILDILASPETLAQLPPAPLLFLPYGLAVLLCLPGGAA